MNLFSLGVCLAGLATFMSSWDRYRWRTIGLVIGIIVVQMMAKLLGVSSETWSWLKACTFFTAYEPEVIVAVAAARPEQAWQLMLADPAGAGRTLGPLGMDLVLLGLGALGYLLAAIIFCRRDLPAPL